MSATVDIERGAPPAVRQAFEELVEAWDGERVTARYDAASRTWMFVCVHSTRLGPAGGGTRIRVYGSPVEGLTDGLRLSAAMTRKLAVAGLPLGGGKAVLAVPAVPQGDARWLLLARYGELLRSLGGSFTTAPDMNTSEADMNVLPHAIGRSETHGGAGTTAPATAVGVLHGIRASTRHALGSEKLSGLVVLVQGVGGVGRRLVELLVEAGARVLVSDVDEARVRALDSRLGVEAVSPERTLETPCDVFAPCAMGGILDARTIPRLRCAVVAGAANNQLGAPSDAKTLREAGILYAPDYVINVGGALHGAGLELLGWGRDELDLRLALTTIYRVADEDGDLDRGVSRAAGGNAAQRLNEPVASPCHQVALSSARGHTPETLPGGEAMTFESGRRLNDGGATLLAPDSARERGKERAWDSR